MRTARAPVRQPVDDDRAARVVLEGRRALALDDRGEHVACVTVSRPVSRILWVAAPQGCHLVAIHLCGLPGDIGWASRPTLGLAPGGGCQPPGSPPTLVRSYRTVSPLPVRTIEMVRHRRSALCCPDRQVTPSWLSPAPSPCGVRTFLDAVERRRGHLADSPSPTRLSAVATQPARHPGTPAHSSPARRPGRLGPPQRPRGPTGAAPTTRGSAAPPAPAGDRCPTAAGRAW
jgi:hypothetical protein